MHHLKNSNHIACFFATSGHSGVDRIVKNLLPGMVEAGYQVDLLKIRNHGPQLTGKSHGVRVIELQAKHVYTAVPGLVSYLRHKRPNVLLTDKDRVNRSAILARLLALAKTRLAVRLGTTVSLNLASRGHLDRMVQRTSMRFLYRYADAIIMPSMGAATDFSQTTGIPRNSISVVPSPIVTPELYKQSETLIDHPWFQTGETPVILGVGELSTRKDFATLLRAFAAMSDNSAYRLVILGRGRQRERLESLARELGIADRFSLPGFVDNPYPYMKRARLLALTSRWEGLGIVLVEALALGTPVVATDCPNGPAEVLGNGRFGSLAPVGDHLALANAMAEQLNQPPTAEQFQQAVTPFSLNNSVAGYLRAMGCTANEPESR